MKKIRSIRAGNGLDYSETQFKGKNNCEKRQISEIALISRKKSNCCIKGTTQKPNMEEFSVEVLEEKFEKAEDR